MNLMNKLRMVGNLEFDNNRFKLPTWIISNTELLDLFIVVIKFQRLVKSFR